MNSTTHPHLSDFPTAKMLKELGFDENINAWYSYYNKESRLIIHSQYFDYNNECFKKDERYSAATWWQIKEWLWLKYKLYITIEEYKNKFQFFVWKRKVNFCLHDDDILFDSPITAETEAIKQAVGWLMHGQQLKEK